MISSDSCSLDRLLVREITHRVKSEFASAIQLASLTAARSSNREVKDALAGVMEQLHNYAMVHNALQIPANNDAIDVAGYVRHLCGSISRSKLKSRGIELTLIEQQFRMVADRCWAMGMIVAELITNAVRHGFNSQGGEIRIECLKSGGYVECRVSDTGLAVDRVQRGNGLLIVEALAEGLDATFKFHLGEAGIGSVLLLPIEPISLVRPTSTARFVGSNSEYTK